MKRRAFIAVLGGAAAAWPLRLFAQGAERPVVGFANGQSGGEWAPYTAAFVHGLRERGYVEGQNVTIEYHWAEGQYGRLTEMVADLVRRRVSVIVISGGASAAVSAAKNETSTIPIAFTTGIDPSGPVSSPASTGPAATSPQPIGQQEGPALARAAA
jgi:putative ABC transport system substrate-binding protein